MTAQERIAWLAEHLHYCVLMPAFDGTGYEDAADANEVEIRALATRLATWIVEQEAQQRRKGRP